MIKVIGLTGLMGAGKSYVATLLNMLGAIIYTTDLTSRKVQISNPKLKAAIIKKFGEQYYINGQVNKDYAKTLFFAGNVETTKNLKWITKTVSPYVRQHFLDYKKQLEDAGIDNMIIVESAILFETGFNKLCDAVICVRSPSPVQATYQRDYTTKEEWQIRMSTQLPDSEKNFDYIINNDYSIAVKSQVNQVFKEITEKYFVD